MTNPRTMVAVSVIIAAYNAEATIATAIASVLAQRDVPLECVVVDDASTDRTMAVIERLAAGDDRLLVRRLPENRGVSAARNVALEIARSDWIAFLDADDRLLPGGLGAMLRAGEGADALAVIGQRISTDGERTWYPKSYDIPDIRTPGRKSLAGNPGLLSYAGPAGKLVHRACADGLQFEGRVLGDQPWVLRALVRAGDRIIVVDDVVYEWRRPHPDRYVPTITSERERSARLAVEAVRMARVAFDTVAVEFDRAYDAPTATRMRAAYVARLLRADLGHQLHAAVVRRDPALPALLDALVAFAEGLPPAAVDAAGDAWRTEVVEYLALHWCDLDGPGRDAAYALLVTLLAIDPATIRRVRRVALRWPLGVGLGRPGLGRALLTAWLTVVGRLGRGWRRLLRRS